MVLLPEPDTPVTAVNIPTGILISIFLRLFSLAPSKIICRPPEERLFGGRAIDSFPDKNLPVSDSSLIKISSGVPRKTTSPPCTPARSEEHTSELQSRLHLVCRL